MNKEILKFCIEKGLLLDKEVYDILSNFEEKEARDIIERISFCKDKIINKSFFIQNSQILKEYISQENREKLCVKLGVSIEISHESVKIEEKEIENERKVKVLFSSINKTKKITVEDFVKYFRSRLSETKKILLDRPELDNLVSINKINGQRQNLSIIGIVSDKRVTKNKNIIFGIEDLTGKINVLVNQNKQDIYDKAKDIILDTVIGVRGTGNRELIFANDVVFPDVVVREKINLERDESCAFISDIHVGSRMFLEKNFLKFIAWINGELGDERQKEEAKKVKYLLITGDTIDGIGVYPGQEKLLDIKDIKEQYARLAFYLNKIRKDVTIILCPGQHDAVRVAEPQPSIDKEYASSLHEIENLILVSNPSMIEITNNGKRGMRILMYHGASMNSLISEIDSLRTIKAHDTPSKIVRYMLKFRHLGPIHSSVTYIPNENTDELAIKEIPDIITTADLHRPDVDIYNNVLIICSSCWQSITPFEEKVGNHPDPCKVPVLNLKTRAIKILDFSDIQEKTCEEKDKEIVCEAK